MKTSLMIDLVLSLGSGTPFLNRFDVARNTRVAMLSGESGQFTIQETARRVARAKGIELAAADVLWGFDLPQLGNPHDLDELATGLKTHGAEVCILDPLYLSLLTAAALGPDAAKNVFAIGPLLLGITRRCLAVGCTPVFVHHANKSIPTGEPMELSSLTGAGCAEFARQWLLLNRREPYRGDGKHSLWLNVGGSCGQGGLFSLTVREGTLEEDFSGRTWEVEVNDAATAFERDAQDREKKRQQAKAAKLELDADAVEAAIRRARSTPPTKNWLRNELGWGDARVEKAIHHLKRVGRIEPKMVTVRSGRNGKAARMAEAYFLPPATEFL
jgi:sugar phosphate isomerase/epimerase